MRFRKKVIKDIPIKTEKEPVVKPTPVPLVKVVVEDMPFTTTDKAVVAKLQNKFKIKSVSGVGLNKVYVFEDNNSVILEFLKGGK